MRISVNYDNGQVFQHFGRTSAFKFYDVEDGKIVSSQVVAADGQGHGALPLQLKQNNVDVVICGGMGQPMMNALLAQGFEVCANITGDCDEAVQAYLEGTLQYNQQAHRCH